MANIDKSFHNGGYTLRIAYTVNSQNVANNTTNITAEVHLISNGSSYNINSSTAKNGTLSINGTSYSFSANVSLRGNQDKTLFTKTVDVPHNSDGTKTCSLSCSLNIQVTLSGRKYNTVTTSGNVTFNTIGRNTIVTTSGTYKFGTQMTINHSRASTAYTITLRYTCGNSSGTIITKQATNSTKWTPPKSLQSEVPKATSIGITIYCDTYNGNTLLGTTSTSFTCTIADDCYPSLGTLSCSNPDTGGTTYWQTVSKLRVEVGYTKAYNSEIAKYVMEVDGQTITNYGYIIWSGTLTGSGAKDVKITITDQRGRSVSKTYTSAINVTAYSKPNITKFTCKRTGMDESGNEVISNLGSIGYFTYAVSWHSSSSNKTRKFMYKPTTSSSWTTVPISNNSYYDYKFSSSLATGSAYDLRIQVSDQVTTVTQDIKMNNLFPLINLSADGTAIAFGKECNASNKFMVMMDASFNMKTQLWEMEVGSDAIFNSWVGFNGDLWLEDKKFVSKTSSDLYFNIQNDFGKVHIHGNTYLSNRGSDNALLSINTSGDGNGVGDGTTHIGYYQDYYGGYGNYFRGLGITSIDTRYGLLVTKGDIQLSSNGFVFTNKISCSGAGWVDESNNETWGFCSACHFMPSTTNRYLGTTAHRWQQLHCVASPNVSSDARNKENVKYMYDKPEVISEFTDVKENDEITTRDLLDFVLNDLHMVTFDYKQSTEDMEQGEIDMVTSMNNRQIGFIAQDIENTKVGKYLVTKDKEGILSYESSNWPSIIAGALQQEIRDRQAADKELMDMLNDIINN